MAYDEFTAKMVKRVGELEQALAEKDREIAKWNELVGAFTQSEHKYLKNHEQLKKAYQQLMEKAVKLAAALQEVKKIAFLVGNDPRLNPCREMGEIAVSALNAYEEAFLKEREGT